MVSFDIYFQYVDYQYLILKPRIWKTIALSNSVNTLFILLFHSMLPVEEENEEKGIGEERIKKEEEKKKKKKRK